MPRSLSSTGVSTAVMNSQEEPIQRLRRPAYGTFEEQRQRRHSWHTRPCVQEAENFHLLVGSSF
jgi:adiponectin receptor